MEQHDRCDKSMQQPETTLIYWAPSRVRFNLTLILAAVVVVLGLLQAAGFDPLAAACSPRASSEPAAQTEGASPEGGDNAASTNRGSAWLLVIVGLGVGAYSWLTSPRQYRVYSDALIIMFGMPRQRTIHFSDIREVVLDRGFMGDPLRVYTVNRRRVPLQVREPEECTATWTGRSRTSGGPIRSMLPNRMRTARAAARPTWLNPRLQMAVNPPRSLGPRRQRTRQKTLPNAVRAHDAGACGTIPTKQAMTNRRRGSASGSRTVFNDPQQLLADRLSFGGKVDSGETDPVALDGSRFVVVNPQGRVEEDAGRVD